MCYIQCKLSTLACFSPPQFTLDSHGRKVQFSTWKRTHFIPGNPHLALGKRKTTTKLPRWHSLLAWGGTLWAQETPSCILSPPAELLLCVCVCLCKAVALWWFPSGCATWFPVLGYLCPVGQNHGNTLDIEDKQLPPLALTPLLLHPSVLVPQPSALCTPRDLRMKKRLKWPGRAGRNLSSGRDDSARGLWCKSCVWLEMMANLAARGLEGSLLPPCPLTHLLCLWLQACETISLTALIACQVPISNGCCLMLTNTAKSQKRDCQVWVQRHQMNCRESLDVNTWTAWSLKVDL